MIPIQITLEQSPRKNQDLRMQTAFMIYNTFNGGNYLIHKTTRAGCTTALVAESLNRDEKFTCAVPTNSIADKTVVIDSMKYSDLDAVDIIHIPANHECLINKMSCEEYPDLRQLPILPLAASCSKCTQYEECPVTAVLRNPEAKGIVVTYKKLASLMLASNSRPNTMASQVLEIISQTRNLILDEVHELQFGDAKSFTVYDNKVFNRVHLEKYEPITSTYPYLKRIITQFALIKEDINVKHAMMDVFDWAQNEDYWKQHLTRSLKNPSPGIVDGENESKVIVGAYNEIIELTKEKIKYELDMDDILELYTLMSIVMSKVISVNAIRDNGVIKVNLSAVDLATVKMIQSYTMSMQSETRRILLTSATICSYDYGKMFMGGVKPVKLSFGSDGDPMRTNSKMLILADSKKYHVIGDRSFHHKKDEILYKVIKILETWGDSECIVIALNTTEANRLENDLTEAGHPHAVTYYKAPEMMGVSASARVMIALGVANKPSNAFDVITTNTLDSKRMLCESVHCDTWQAWSRVKDPSGNVPSVVFALGCTVEDCMALTKWGYDRQLDIKPYKERQKKRIEVQCDRGIISTPKVCKCKNFDEMLKEASLHKLPKLSDKKHENLLILKDISSFYEKTSETLHSSTDLIKRVLNRLDAYAVQNPNGGYFKVKNPVSDSVLEKHIEGSLTIGAYQFNLDNEVKWVCFDIDSHAPKNVVETEDDVKKRDEQAEQDKERMCNFLTNADIPFLLEKSGSPHSYHIWIFVNPVDGKTAKHFCQAIKKEVGIECEIFPKQSSIGKDGYGNLVKVPLATHQIHKTQSQIMVNGEYVRDFQDLEIGVLDISKFELPEEKHIPKIKAKPIVRTVVRINGKVKGNIRPCIKDALTQSLCDGHGHFMRMAIAREFYEDGMKVEDVAKLFQTQTDYDYDYSLRMVNSLVSKPGKRFRCDRIRVDGAKFVKCDGCEYLGRWE